MSNVSSALERAKEKLALPVAGNNSNVAPEPFPGQKSELLMAYH